MKNNITNLILCLLIVFSVNSQAFALDSTINIQLVDSNNNTFTNPTGSDIFVSCNGNSVYVNGAVADGASSTSLVADIATTTTINCFISSAEGYGQRTPSSISLAPGASSNIDLVVYPKDAVIHVSLLDVNSNPIQVPSGSTVSVSCQSESPSNYTLTRYIYAGEDSVDLEVFSSSDQYACSAYGFPDATLQSSLGQFSVSTGATVNAPFTVLNHDSTIEINLQDQNNNVVIAPSGGVFISCTSPNLNAISSTISVGNSTTSFATISGRSYTCSSAFISGYGSPNSVSVTPTSGNTSQIDFEYILSDATLNVSLIDQNGNPVVSAVDSYVSCTNHLGNIFTTIPAGDSTVQLSAVSGRTYICDVPYIQNNFEGADVTITPVTGSNDLELTYVSKDTTLTINFKDEDGDPIANSGGNVSCLPTAQGVSSQYGGYSNLTSGLTSVTITVVSGFQYGCLLNGTFTGYAAPGSQMITPASGPVSLDFEFETLDLNLSVNLLDSNGDPFLVPSGQSVSVSCSSTGHYTSGSVTAGNSSTSLSLFSGRNYYCSTGNLSGFQAPTGQTINASPGSTSANFSYLATDGSIIVELKDGFGQAISVPSGDSAMISCYPTAGGSSVSGTIASGNSSVNIPVISNRNYSCSLSGLDSFTAGSNQTALVPNTGTANVIFTLESLDATLTLNLKDKNGQAVLVPNGLWGNIFCSGIERYLNFSSTLSPNSSQTSFNLKGGLTYSCTLSPFGNNGGGKVNIRVTAGDSVSADIIVLEKDGTLNISLVDKAGQVISVPTAQTMVISCYDTAGRGYYASQNLQEGESSASVNVISGVEYSCSGYNAQGLTQITNGYGTPQSGSSADVKIVFAVELGSITLSLVDINGSPVTVPSSSQYPSINCDSSAGQNNLYYYRQLSSGDSEVSFTVVDNTTYNCGVYGLDGYVLLQNIEVPVATGGASVANLVLAEANAEINVSLRKSDSSAYTLPNGSYGYISCYDNDAGHYFSKSMQGGESSATIKTIAGNYTCSLSSSSDAAKDFSVTSVANSSVNGFFDIIDTNAQLHVKLVDGGGAILSTLEGASAYVYSDSPELRHSATVALQNGEGTLEIVAGVPYSVSVWVDGYSSIYGVYQDSNGIKYIQSRNFTPISATAGATVEYSSVFVLADANAKVSVSGIEGESWVSVSDVSDSESSIYISGETLEKAINIPLGGGKKYRFEVYPNDSSAIAPAAIEKEVQSGDDIAITFDIKKSDFNLSITGLVTETVTGEFGCFAFSDLGSTYSPMFSAFGQSVTLPLVSSSPTWTIQCQGYSDDKFFDSGEITYNIPNGATTADLTVNLMSVGNKVNAQTTVPANGSGTIVSGDLTIDVAAGAFNQNTTVSVNSVTAPNSVGPAFDIDAFATDDQEQQTPNKPLAFSFIAPSDANPDSLEVVIYNDQNQIISRPPSTIDSTGTSGLGNRVRASKEFSLKDSGVSVSVSLSSLSGKVALIKKSNSRTTPPSATPTPVPTSPPSVEQPAPTPTPKPLVPPSAVTGLKASFKTKRSGTPGTITINWKKSTLATSYLVELYEAKAKKGKQPKKLKSATVKAPLLKYVFNKVKKGAYQIVVTAVNADGKSAGAKKNIK